MNKTSSFRIIRTAAVMFVASAAVFVMSQTVNAQCRGYGGGYGGGYIGGYGGSGLTIVAGGGGYGYGRGVSVGYSSYRPVYRRPTWHNTTHLDYHPGGVVRHGNHYDRIPGHYDVHRTGHWHR